MPTLTELYERTQVKDLTTQVYLNGILINHGNPSWGNEGFGTVPTATFQALKPLPSTLVERAEIAIYAGFNGVTKIVFAGTIENVRYNQSGAQVECAGASRSLKLLYDRLVVTLASVDATVAVTNLFQGAGVVNYHVDLPAWTIGVTIPGVIEFQTYGDAINQIAIVDGSPFYEMPDGQCRVEVRDPIPGPSAFRSYYSGVLSGLTAAQKVALDAGTLALTAIQPAGISDTQLQPRLRSLDLGTLFSEVKNKITALGAVVTSTGAGGQQTSERLEATVDAPSPFIPTPPTYYTLQPDRPLVDDIDKLTTVALREYMLNARLQESGVAVVDGDPEMFLGCTVYIADQDYSGKVGRYFVAGYRTTVSESDFVTELQITGGGAAGNTPTIAPFACFAWAVTGKLTQVLPVGIGPGGVGTVITFDGGCSRDFDGTIASYAWSDTEGNVGTGRLFQAVYDPGSVSSVDMTLTVTDADGNTDSVTKTVDVAGDDSGVGGQQTLGTHIFVAAEEFAMGSSDGGATWNDLSRAAAGVSGLFIRCACQYTVQGMIAIFVTDLGEVVMTTDACVTSFKPEVYPGSGPALGPLTTGASAGIIPFHTVAAASWLSLEENGLGSIIWYTDAAPDAEPQQNYWAAASIRNIPAQDYRRVLPAGPEPWQPLAARSIREAFQSGTLGMYPSPFVITGGDSGNPASNLVMRGFVTIPWLYVEGHLMASGSGPEAVFNAILRAGSGALAAAAQAAGAGFTVVGAVAETPSGSHATIFNAKQRPFIFDGGVSPRAWYVNDDTTGEEAAPATGLPAGDGIDMAGGIELEEALVVMTGPASRYALDGFTYGTPGVPPSQVNRVLHEPGQHGTYIGAATGGVVKSIDFGANWGYVRPHAGIGSTWPAGAVGRDIAFTPSSPATQVPDLFVAGTAAYKRFEAEGAVGVWNTKDGAPPDTNGSQLKYFGNGKLGHITGAGLFRISLTTGDTWNTRALPGTVESLESYDISPDATVWVLAFETTPATDQGLIYSSINDGSSWTLSLAAFNLLQPLFIAVNPSNSNQIAATYKATDGTLRIVVSQNAGTSWVHNEVNAGTLRVGRASGKIAWVSSRIVVAYDLEDGRIVLSWSEDFGATWTNGFDEDQGAAATRIVDLLSGGALGPLFCAAQRTPAILRSVNQGESWEGMAGE